MIIRKMTYSFWSDRLWISEPWEVIKETETCYYIGDTYGFFKSEIDKPIARYRTNDPYIVLAMIDTDEETMRKVMTKWFQERIDKILNK